jgi:trigger factor
MIGDLESYLRYQGMSLDQFIEMSGKSREDMREDKREEATERAKANLVLDAIAKKEGITADDSEIEAKIAEIAESYNDEPERIKTILENQGRIPVMKEEIRIRKVIDLLVEKADIEIVKKPATEKPKKTKKAAKNKAEKPEKEEKAKKTTKKAKAEGKDDNKPKTAAKPIKNAAKKVEDKQEDGDKSES